jgi:hypothetical protein
MSGGAATITSDGAYKAATDTDPVPPLTPDQQKTLDQKQRAAVALMTGNASGSSSTASSNAAAGIVRPSAVIGGPPYAYALTQDQNPQKNDHYCGPATVNEALGQMGKWFTQVQLAGELGTTDAGTGWGNAYSGPVPRVMNLHQTRNSYYGNPLPNSPSNSDVIDFQAALVNNIWAKRAPLIGDAYEVPGGPHLAGHPDRLIFHWFDIYGYSGNGNYTMYEDSVHGVPSSVISWAPNVPAYSTMLSRTIVQILGGRGYVW